MRFPTRRTFGLLNRRKVEMNFSSKAGTLLDLTGRLKSGIIAAIFCFTVEEWQTDRQRCLSSIRDSLGLGPWIVRSSSALEDGVGESNAGRFLSLLDVEEPQLEESIERVIASYNQNLSSDEVLVQPMLANVIRSGVAFSHDPHTSAPYRIINWSEGSDTTEVTGGKGGRVWQQAAKSSKTPPEHLRPILELLDELLTLFDNAPLDCEFAVTREKKGEVLWLLQIRPLILPSTAESEEVQRDRLEKISLKIEKGTRAQTFLMGKRTVYGVMPDWNPAEIIGIRPKPLALSLYRDLVTDSIWAYQRHNYGYRNLRSFPLMPHFFGLPYIDVRVSFNSFIPADLDDSLAGRLVDYYVDQLLAEPALHDKVEFEVVFSCYSLDLESRLEALGNAGFTAKERDEIAESLRTLTNRIVHPKHGLWRADAEKIDTLNQRRDELLASDTGPLERIYWLLEDTKRYGTLPFAGLARAGFIAVQMLRSLVATGVFSQEDYSAFLRSLSTISGQLSRDRASLDKTTFLARYGHLRPGTYDISSPRYDEAPDLYFNWDERPPAPEAARPFSLTLQQMRKMGDLLEEHCLEIDPIGLLDFMQAGIELRELAKFHFSRNLSDAMVLISRVGQEFGLTQNELAYCDIDAFRELYVAAADPEKALSYSIQQGKMRYAETLRVSLPPLISSPDDVWAFEWPETSPNFITQKDVTAPVVSSHDRSHLSGAIVAIPNADPGFDWLFAMPIAGLITAWGGANSHMAIRAGELGLPAVIGAGEVFYNQWSKAEILHIDCAGRRVEVVA